uniref:Peroxisomal biogenesis factor 12 n=1 Tax=Nephromyces sp. MMRI TaxID=2496275 RepID=A0A3Q8UC83_9APIC|nr:peroxisomal biogenesis factor 12 [Nephromyces sp. MMRI]
MNLSTNKLDTIPIQPTLLELSLHENLLNSIEEALLHFCKVFGRFIPILNTFTENWDLYYTFFFSACELISLLSSKSSLSESFFNIERFPFHNISRSKLLAFNLLQDNFRKAKWISHSESANKSALGYLLHFCSYFKSSIIKLLKQLIKTIPKYHISLPASHFIFVFIYFWIPLFFRFFNTPTKHNFVRVLVFNYNRGLLNLNKKLNNRICKYFMNIISKLKGQIKFSHFFINSYADIRLIYKSLTIIYHILYAIDSKRWPYWTPIMHFLGLIYIKRLPTNHLPNNSSIFKISRLLKVLFILLAHIFLFYEWITKNIDNLTRKHFIKIHPPPTPYKTKICANISNQLLFLPEDPSICAICHQTKINPSCIPTGYVFCYRCIMHFLKNNQCCPITGIAFRQNQVRRLFETSL